MAKQFQDFKATKNKVSKRSAEKEAQLRAEFMKTKYPGAVQKPSAIVRYVDTTHTHTHTHKHTHTHTHTPD